MNLLIVESPNKIKKLKSFLGSDWDVAASVGHIRDLPSKGLSIDKAGGYKMLYEVNSDKRSVVSGLKKKVENIGKPNVYLATDPDREGEAIAFHLCAALGLDYKSTKRVTFQEITEKAVKKAISQPRTLDLKLVAAQESRRAIDRLVGYEISPVLWKKLESGLSAGRVQSVALKLCVEREKVIKGFSDKYNFQVKGFFQTKKGDTLRAKRIENFHLEKDAAAYLQASKNKTFKVSDVVTRPTEKAPQPPYSTSTLQQDGVKKLRMNVKQVMDVAQKLFEGGHITYMRTDSLNLSQEAIDQAQEQISSKYGPSYFRQRTFRSKAGSQEAHEAIRPTHWENTSAGNNDDEEKLYDLIYRRALASQMAAAKYDETTITIVSSQPNDVYSTVAKVLTFDGYLKVYQEETEEEEENDTIKPVSAGEGLEMIKLEATQTYAKPPKRLDQASLVAELEKKQIGRPSTYASILNTILKREYVKTGNEPGRKVTAAVLVLEDGKISRVEKQETLGADKNKLLPTEKGIRLTEFLEHNFTQVVDYTFTATCEEDFDQIADGKKKFGQIVPAFDQQLSGWLQKVEIIYKDVPKDTGLDLGAYEDLPLLTGKGKYGAFIKHGDSYYNIDEKTLKGINREQAISLILEKRALAPKVIGSLEGKKILVGKGKYGTYVKWNDKYYSIEGREPSQVTQQDALAAIKNKVANKGPKDQDKSIVVKIGKKFQIRMGKWGLYLTDGKTNAKVPAGVSEEELKAWTEDKCRDVFKSYNDWKKKSASK